jgi:hypothetical protein
MLHSKLHAEPANCMQYLSCIETQLGELKLNLNQREVLKFYIPSAIIIFIKAIPSIPFQADQSSKWSLSK